MTLEEEYENQQSWRSARDKLTFIVCAPLEAACAHIQAGREDSNGRMRGDINFFLYPYESEDDEDVPQSWLTGEVDVMIADKDHRGKGLGRAAVCMLLAYLKRNIDAILREHAEEGVLRGLMVKIKQDNAASVALFRKLGFLQKGEVNYFGEITMTMAWDVLETLEWWDAAWEDYREMGYVTGGDGEH